jgi:STE24 endopeptidase
MVQVLLIILFVTPHLFDVLSARPALPLPAWQAVAAVLAPMAAMWAIYHALCLHWGRKLDTTGRVELIRTAENTMLGLRLLATALWGFGIFGLGYFNAVRSALGDTILLDELLTIAPVLLFITATWWSIYPLELRLRDALLLRELDNHHGHPVHPPLTRTQYVASGIRHQMMLFLAPLAMMTAWQETTALKITPWLIESHRALAPTLIPIVEYAGILTVLIVSPAVMRRVWDTVPIAPGALRDQVQAMCRRYKVRVRGPLLWRTHGSLVNGAILGIFWPLRYMLLTDALLERLTADQVEAVMAHEVAHVRRHHLIWLAICIMSTVVMMFWLLKGVLDGLPTPVTSHGTVSLIMGLGGLVGAGTVFGLVSRRFEWQADAFAVQHMTRARAELDGTPLGAITPQAVGAMAGALQSVADLNGIDPDTFTWRHGSVTERLRRLRRLIDKPINALPIDRQVLWIKAAAVVGLVVSVLPMILQFLGVRA